MTSKVDVVGSAIWARDLTTEELERARRGMIEKQFAKGSYLCHRGDRFDHWGGVVSGLLKMSAITRGGKPMTFAGIGAGEWFGEGSVLKDEPRKYDLVAIRDSRVLLMGKSTFFWLYDNSVGFNRFLVRQLNERLAYFIATTEHERVLDPKARVARNLAWLCRSPFKPIVERHVEITQEELALLVGVSRPVVGRSLQDLETEGLVVLEHSRIRVQDLEALAEYET